MTAIPAAPTPVTTTFTSSIRLPTTRSALRNAASTTTAVPCWSSWKTGMSSDARSRSSTSKQRGAEMSSRLMPPKPGAIASTAATIWSGSWVLRQIGHASTPPNSLNSSALPSITGIAASGPMSPSPSTALPSVTTATVLRLIVRLHALSGSAAIAWQTRATPGVYAMDRSSRVFTGAFEFMWIFPPRWSRNVRSETRSTVTPGTSRQASDDLVRVGRVRREHADVADLARRLDADEVDRVEQAARVGDRARKVGEAARPVVEADAEGEAEGGGVVAHTRASTGSDGAGASGVSPDHRPEAAPSSASRAASWA